MRACKVQIHVVTQFCQVPKYLNINCDRNQNRTCSFTCRDPTTEPTGANSLTCRDDLKWNGHLPSCNGTYVDLWLLMPTIYKTNVL